MDVKPNGVNGSCYCQADVICLIYLIGRCYCQEVDGIPPLIADVIVNDVADVFTTTVYCNYFLIGRCYCLVADGIATCYLIISVHGQMLLPCGRWNWQLYCCEG